MSFLLLFPLMRKSPEKVITFSVCVFQAVLQTGGQLELEVRPLFLVPDTNGFIDHLGGLRKLLQCGTYIIVVPLIGKKGVEKDKIYMFIKYMFINICL